ncbi:signal peptidase II [Pedobacter sp. CG_S7]|uniref:signal peptidase II n=1 Tax=Pedobacter sp. CG_S7 TaxID=3143930 RepID=UPI0033948A86
MKRKVFLKKVLLFLVICCNIGCDQISKSIARNELGSHEQVKFLYNRLTLIKVENSGAFLSFGDKLPVGVKFVFLSLLPLMFLAYGLYYLLTKPGLEKVYAIGLCFVIGGGIGNLFDRILYGAVTDFLHLDLGVFQTGVFNLADVSIMIGMVMLLFQIYQQQNGQKQLKSTTEQSVDIV